MRIKSRPTVDNAYLAKCRRMEAAKRLEIEESKKLIELRRQVGAKPHEGRVRARSAEAVMNAVLTEGKEVLTSAGKSFWADMERRYKWQAPDGNWSDGNSPNGHVNRLGKVRERMRGGRWEHWDNRLGGWVPGEITPRKGIGS